MISLQSLHVDSQTYIFSNIIKSFCPKFNFWWMVEQMPKGLYCLHFSSAIRCVQLDEW